MDRGQHGRTSGFTGGKKEKKTEDEKNGEIA